MKPTAQHLLQLVLLLLGLHCAGAAGAQQYNATAAGHRYRHQYQDHRNEHNVTSGRPSGNWTEDSVMDQNAYSAAVDTYLSSASVLYGVIGQSSRQVVNAQCHQHLLATAAAIHRRDVWAMKMLDASATAQPGFVWGNQFWLGSRQQCESVQVRKHITLSPRFVRNMKPQLVDARAPFDVGYRVVYARHESPWQVEVEFLLSAKVLHLGVCVPQACSHRDIHLLVQAYLDSSLMEAQNLLVNQANVMLVKDLQLGDAFYAKMSLKIVGAFVLFTVLMVTLATLYEPTRNSTRTDKSVVIAETGTDAVSDAKYDGNRNDIAPEAVHVKEPHHSEPTTIERFVGCFSLSNNLRSVLSTASPATAVPAVNAFKSIGCLMILNFHLPWYSLFTINNGAELFVLGEQFKWQWLSTTPIIVDIFFAISGLLLAYNFLRNEKRVAQIRDNSLWANLRLYGKQFVHRYLRLTPLYLVVCGLTEIGYAYMADTSPFWIKDRIDLVCQNNWWRNVLYVQNFFQVTEMCLNWTWSLACEMQFFLLVSALLFVYVRHPVAARRAFVTLYATFTVVLAVISWRLKFTPAYDVLHDLGTELYTSPWVRVLPYLSGVASGWYLQQSAGRPLPLRQQTVQLLWTLATTVMLICHMATYVRDSTHVVGVPMIVGVRLLYGGSACWMIVASMKGQGGWFARVTGWPVFVHLNKLSYGIYLLNPIVVALIYGLSDHSASVEPITQITASVGIMVIVYLMSFVFSLLFEMPYTKLSAEILRGRKLKVM